MKRFIDATIKPVLIIGGFGTAAACLYAFFPGFAVENLNDQEFVPEYTIFVQHWGLMVGLLGIFMVAAAFRESWRAPVLLFGLIEKVWSCHHRPIPAHKYVASFSICWVYLRRGTKRLLDCAS